VIKEKRDRGEVEASLQQLGKAADRFAAKGDVRGESLVPRIVDAVRARATVGEISNVLRSRWGTYKPTR
jgi:methylmalonyl-CoA mutase N-terminal domain/subunit